MLYKHSQIAPSGERTIPASLSCSLNHLFIQAGTTEVVHTWLTPCSHSSPSCLNWKYIPNAVICVKHWTPHWPQTKFSSIHYYYCITYKHTNVAPPIQACSCENSIDICVQLLVSPLVKYKNLKIAELVWLICELVKKMTTNSSANSQGSEINDMVSAITIGILKLMK